jgi:hypothetical protein
MRFGILAAAALALTSGAASAEQTCTTRADGSYNCTTTVAASTATATNGGTNHRAFVPDDTGLLRVPTQDGETLFHCDNVGPCKEIGVNPPVINRQ